MRRSLGSAPSVFALLRAGSLESNPQVFAKRAGTFAAAAGQLGGAVLLTWRTGDGISSRVLLPTVPARWRDSASTAAVHLAQAVGAQASLVDDGWCLDDELPGVDGLPVAWLRFRPGDPASRDSQIGADPAELSRLVARSMSEGMWAAVLLRPASAGERRRHVAWLEHRMQTRNPVHHSMSTDSVVVSVVAGGADRQRLQGFLAGLAAGMPGLDLAAVARADSLRALRWRRGVFGSAMLAAAAVVGAGLQVWTGRLHALLGGVVGVDVVAAVLMVLAVVAGVAGVWWWQGLVRELSGRASTWTGRLLHATVTNRWPLPRQRRGLVRAPRVEKSKMVDGVEVRQSASPGDYPFEVASTLVGAEVVAGVVAPQSGALHAAAGGESRQVPPQVLTDIGPVVGVTSAGPVHLSAADAPYGFGITGAPGTGKTMLVNALWATDACDRAQPSGRAGMPGSKNTLVYFDQKGDEVASLQRWAAAAGDRVTVVDVGDEDSFGIDFFDGPGTAAERAALVLNAMVYAFGKSSIQSRSQETLSAVLTGALAVDGDVLAVAREQGGLESALPEGVSPSRVELAHILCGGRGDDAAVALFAAICGEAVRRSQHGGAGAQDLSDAAGKLSVYYQGQTASGRRTALEAGRNKLDLLTQVPFWWTPGRRRLSWDQVLEEHHNVVINFGRSATGRLLDDEVQNVLAAMMFFLLRNAIQRTCSGWQKRGRAVSVYTDELALIASNSEGVMEWLRDQGRSYGVRLRLATQRASQLPAPVHEAFLTMSTLVAFRQDNKSAADAAAEQLGVRSGDWSAEDVLTLQQYTAAYRTHVNQNRLPAFVMHIPNFFGEGGASVGDTVTKWGYRVVGDTSPTGSAAADAVGERGAVAADVAAAEPGVPASAASVVSAAEPVQGPDPAAGPGDDTAAVTGGGYVPSWALEDDFDPASVPQPTPVPRPTNGWGL